MSVKVLRSLTWELLKQSIQWFKGNRIYQLTVAFMTVLLVAILGIFDKFLLGRISEPMSGNVKELARQFSLYGDYPIATLGLASALIGLGYALKRVRWVRLGLACLLAGSLAGLAANTLRPTLGRARPLANMEDGLYGPSLDYRFHGFPSAHAATSMGTAIPVLVAAPLVGGPLFLGALGVSWSRVNLRWHYPSDVVAGMMLGVFFGIPLGWACRREGSTFSF